jgi:outer membrane immunogenic protein
MQNVSQSDWSRCGDCQSVIWRKKMRNPIVLAAAAIGFLAAPGLSMKPVRAADIGQAAPAIAAPAPVAAAPVANWSGYFIGALLGHAWGETDNAAIASPDIDGFEGGVYIGANSQWNQFVLGVEADALISGAEGSAGAIGADQDWSVSLRARAGIALDRFLLYGTGGVAASGVELSDATSSDNNILWGWTLGAGAEALLRENVTARVEYRYTDFGSETYTLDSGAGDADLQIHSVRAGVGLKF